MRSVTHTRVKGRGCAISGSPARVSTSFLPSAPGSRLSTQTLADRRQFRSPEMSPPHPKFYLLPFSPEYKCTDRFSLHPTGDQAEDENGQVPFWPVLEAILCRPVNSTTGLVDILDTISVILRETSQPAGDYELLIDAIATSFDTAEVFFAKVWSRIVDIALQMPVLFQNGRIPVLSRENYSLPFSRRQIACLVVHQFLRTLSLPPFRDDDGTHDFGIWYSSQQRHPVAVRGYLRALMLYFGDVLCDEKTMDGWVVEYSLHSLPENYDEISAQDRPLSELKVVVVETYDTLPGSLGVGDGDGQAVVISANRVVGFGQSATQEEVHVGISPEACPIVLFTPPLGDEQVLKVRGAQAMVNVVGKGRDIIVGSMLDPPQGGDATWKFRTMLFMDALELDLVNDGRLADLDPGNMEREIAKAYTAFSSSLDGTISEIKTGPWGCGAFRGDPEVKMLLLWLASSMVGVNLTVVCDYELQTFARKLEEVGQTLKFTMLGTVSMRKLLMELPQALSRGQTLEWLEKRK